MLSDFWISRMCAIMKRAPSPGFLLVLGFLLHDPFPLASVCLTWCFSLLRSQDEPVLQGYTMLGFRVYRDHLHGFFWCQGKIWGFCRCVGGGMAVSMRSRTACKPYYGERLLTQSYCCTQIHTLKP